jgi:hypothetical protein
MASRNSFAWFVLLMGASATIFFFIRDEDILAMNTIFFTFYITATIIYFLRIFFYIDNKATLNEIYFFSLANIIPLVVLAAGLFFPLGQEPIVWFNIVSFPADTTIVLQITYLSILVFPYLAVSTALLIRSFTRYQFIRLTAHSERGPSAEWTAIITFFVFGILFLIVGFITSDLIGLFYGTFFLCSGIGFILGR